MNLRLSLAVLSLAALATASSASIAYTDLTSVDYSGGAYGGWFTGGYNPAFEFTSSLTGTTDDILVDVGDWFDVVGSVPFQINLYQDGGSNDSLGTLLGSWTGYTDATTTNSYYGALVDVSTPGASLNSGGRYWVEMQYGAYGDFSYYQGPIWAENSANVMQNLTESGSFWGSNPAGAYQVNATSVASSSVPGPAAAAPFLIGLLALRRRK